MGGEWSSRWHCVIVARVLVLLAIRLIRPSQSAFNVSDLICERQLLKNRDCRSFVQAHCGHELNYVGNHGAFREAGDILVSTAIDSVGNFLLGLMSHIELAQFLHLAILIDTKDFEGMNVMIEPNAADWMYDSTRDMLRRGSVRIKIDDTAPTYVILSESYQKKHAGFFEMLNNSKVDHHSWILRKFAGRTQGEHSKGGDTSCFLNLLFRKTVFAHHIFQKANSNAVNITNRSTPYAAWHVRTSASEDKSFNSEHHGHVLRINASAAWDVFYEQHKQQFPLATGIFVSTDNTATKEVMRAKALAANASFYTVDHKISESAYHTHNSPSVDASIASFLDLFFMLRAEYLLYSLSSYPRSIIIMLNMDCVHVTRLDNTGRRVLHKCWRRLQKD